MNAISLSLLRSICGSKAYLLYYAIILYTIEVLKDTDGMRVRKGMSVVVSDYFSTVESRVMINAFTSYFIYPISWMLLWLLNLHSLWLKLFFYSYGMFNLFKTNNDKRTRE